MLIKVWFFIAIIINSLGQVFGNEPDFINVIMNGKISQINFSKLQKVEIEAINYHPNFVNNRKSKYSGYLIKDILKIGKSNPNQKIVIVGKTGQFSIELYLKELMNGNNIIATHVNGQEVTTDGNGLQIIYDTETIKKYPQLQQRSFWCWWVRSIILDENYPLKLNKISKTRTNSKADLPWPMPYGTSSIKQYDSPNERKGFILSSFKKLKLKLLNGIEKEIVTDNKSKFFLTKNPNYKMGGYSLHQIVEEDMKVIAFVNNHYYLESLEKIE